MTEMFTVNDLK